MHPPPVLFSYAAASELCSLALHIALCARSKRIRGYLLEKPGKSAAPVIFASPHSGTFYPERLFSLTTLLIADLRKYEDAEADKLFSFLPAMGIPLLSAVYGRAWVDLNRHPLELDPTMYFDAVPPQSRFDSARPLFVLLRVAT